MRFAPDGNMIRPASPRIERRRRLWLAVNGNVPLVLAGAEPRRLDATCPFPAWQYTEYGLGLLAYLGKIVCRQSLPAAEFSTANNADSLQPFKTADSGVPNGCVKTELG